MDHLHFQYNGFLLGMLLLSISFLEEGKDLMGGLIYAALLCFKHLFAVAAPVYFVYLFRHYCTGGLVKGFAKLVVMGSGVVVVFAAAYGPFVYHGQVLNVCVLDLLVGKLLGLIGMMVIAASVEQVVQIWRVIFGFDFLVCDSVSGPTQS